MDTAFGTERTSGETTDDRLDIRGHVLVAASPSSRHLNTIASVSVDIVAYVRVQVLIPELQSPVVPSAGLLLMDISCIHERFPKVRGVAGDKRKWGRWRHNAALLTGHRMAKVGNNRLSSCKRFSGMPRAYSHRWLT